MSYEHMSPTQWMSERRPTENICCYPYFWMTLFSAASFLKPERAIQPNDSLTQVSLKWKKDLKLNKTLNP